MTTHEDRYPTDAAGLPEARAPQTLDLEDGDRVDLRISPVAKQLGGARVRLLSYGGSIPGPTLRVRQGAELFVDLENDGDLEATVHWHGLRLDNRFDGTLETQAPVPVGGRFRYRLTFPDPGVYWYHPHIREDYAQELGLYGNIVVMPEDPDYWGPVHRELVLVLDDLLIEDGQLAPFLRSGPTHSAMGRFGNVLLVNGETDHAMSAKLGEVVRLYLTNTANARVFDVVLPGARMKLVGGDSGRVEREEFVDRVVLGPSERAVVEVLFDVPGRFVLEHQTPERSYRLASIDVADERARPALERAFETLHESPELRAERERLPVALAAVPDRTLVFVAEMGFDTLGSAESYVCPMHPEIRSHEPTKCPECGMKLVPEALVGASARPHGASGHHGHAETAARAPLPAWAAGIEWEDDMAEVNRLTTSTNTRWKLIDAASGAEGRAIDFHFRVGDRVKIRLVSSMDSDHPMHHPFHIHGAGRFLVLARDGVVEPNLVWKDTVLVRTGQTVDLLLEVTHPGRWMAHCHIAEHHESGMMMSFVVDP